VLFSPSFCHGPASSAVRVSEPVHVHATAVLLGSFGVLLRGPSGSGKSLLALALLDRWESRNQTASLVADDQVRLTRADGVISMAVPERIAGLIELRFRGPLRRPYRSPVDLHLVVDLLHEATRLPEPSGFSTDLLGIAVARAPVPRESIIGLGHQVILVVEALAALRSRH